MHYFWDVFYDFKISNLSQKIETQNEHCFLGYLNFSYKKLINGWTFLKCNDFPNKGSTKWTKITQASVEQKLSVPMS